MKGVLKSVWCVECVPQLYIFSKWKFRENLNLFWKDRVNSAKLPNSPVRGYWVVFKIFCYLFLQGGVFMSKFINLTKVFVKVKIKDHTHFKTPPYHPNRIKISGNPLIYYESLYREINFLFNIFYKTRTICRVTFPESKSINN